MAVFSQKQDEWWIILYKGKHLVFSETTATILFLFRRLIWSLVRSLNISITAISWTAAVKNSKDCSYWNIKSECLLFVVFVVVF